MAVDDRLGSSLRCGTPVAVLLEQVTEGTEPGDPVHQATCPHCLAALAAFNEGWNGYERATRTTVRAPRDLHARVMRRVWDVASRPRGHAVLHESRGDTRISGWVLARIAGRAASSVPGVVSASVLDAAPDAGQADRVSLSLRLAIAFGPSVDGLASAVRMRVGEDLRAFAGVGAVAVDISVEELADPDPSDRTRNFWGSARSD